MRGCVGTTGSERMPWRLGGLPLALCSLAVLCLLPRPGEAGTALNQLCGAAGYGSGCVGAFKAPKTTIPRVTAPRAAAPRVAPRGGGAFGGMGGMLMGMFLEQALSSAIDASVDTGAAEAAAQAQTAEAARVQALQEAVREQQRLQEEREAQFSSQLLDRPASQLIGGSQDLSILESARAEAGSPFDGNDPHTAWTTLHDAWYTPEATGGLHAGSNPVPVGEGSIAPAMQPLQCAGRICAFPPGSARVPLVRTAPTDPGSQPGLSGSSSRIPGVATEWRQVGDRVVWAARRDIADALDRTRGPEVPAAVLGSGAIAWAQQALPGMQREIAREGRDIYQRVMEELIGETFGVLSDAVAGRWEQARERSDRMGDAVRESILPQFKMARLFLSGDGAGAGRSGGELLWKQAKEVATGRAMDDLLDRLPGPEWVREGARHSADMADHWLQAIGVK